jgi:uncharacterized membrane protein YeaQ/YmgE (transglycosylase-associated protein family)
MMTLIGFLILVIIAMVVGTLAQSIAGYSLGGFIISAVVGFIGAFIGRWIAGQFGLPEPLPVTIDGETFPIIWAIIGSVIFVAIVGLFTRRRRRYVRM